ncbi:MAG: phosphoglycerate dehydrogenase [Nitrospinota bacterium]
MKVLISDKLSDEGIKILENTEGVDVTVKTGMSPEEILKEIPNYHGLIVRSATKVTKELIEAGTNLKVIGRAGIGVDNIDVHEASQKGIIVMNTPEGNTVTTAEHAISMMLSLARSIPQACSSMKSGKWDKKFMGVELYNKTIGVIGLGRIGSIVANRAKGLAMKVLAFDPFISAERAETLGVTLASFEELIQTSDFITIHVPKTSDTEYLIGEKEFSMMKKGVRVINCARGGILDEKALLENIEKKQVAGAALDVYETEPLAEDHPLRNTKEVILTPHLGASTSEAQVNVAIDVADQIVDFLKNGQIKNAINVPSLDASTLSEIQPYIQLGEKIGKVLSQLIEGGVEEVSVDYSGTIVDLGLKPVTLSTLKGFLDGIVGEGINMINAPFVAKERGIRVKESSTSSAHNFSSLITVQVKTGKMTKQISGTVFGKNDQRIVRIDDYWVEASPSEFMLIFSNKDNPGVIGTLGNILAEGDVNIAGLQLGRNHPRGDAVSIMNIDSDIPKKVLSKLTSQTDMNYVKMIRL